MLKCPGYIEYTTDMYCQRNIILYKFTYSLIIAGQPMYTRTLALSMFSYTTSHWVAVQDDFTFSCMY